MAFSTQQDFFHVPFMNETVAYACKPACVKLKSYESSLDYRSWSSDRAKQSKFLSDLVTCQIPSGNYVHGQEPVSNGELSDSPSMIDNTEKASHSGVVKPSRIGATSHSDAVVPTPRTAVSQSAIMVKAESTLQNELHGLSVGDSLLECANIHLTDYQKLKNIKNSLEKQLETSNERLKSTHEENRKIIEILNSKLDSNTSKDFYNKIQKLITAGKLTKNEENEMLQVHQKIENILKFHDALQAENNYLKRLIEKLSYRITMEHIKTEKETSTDINYLQEQINALRKECVMLRAMEEDYYKAIQQTRIPAIISDRDAENINAIIRERNTLREKCKSLKGLEKVVVELQNKAKESDSTNSALNSNLNDQSSYIKNLECKMEKMAKYYKEQLQEACSTEQCLKHQIQDLKADLVKYKCKAHKVETLQEEIGCMLNEISKRDMVIRDYDCQYKQLMFKAKRIRDCRFKSEPIVNCKEADGDAFSDNQLL